ncbi:MAG: penicillin-binding protein 2, partial [Candidatus Competibacteraceae bacterium]|nr:penicillin-binding protein 2 [Candidatus Competibacteraceae bacterium]
EQGSNKLQIKTARPLEPVHIADPLSWDVVIQAMVKVVHSERGTARRIARGIAYTAAGKTGTAQVFSLGEEEEYDAEQLARRLHDHALFIAFAPAEQPQIAIAVIAEHGGGGGSVAAPIGRQVLDAYLLQNNRLTQGADS